jgi:hypothetical protein
MLPVHALPSLTAQKFATNLGRALQQQWASSTAAKIHDCIDESQSAAPVSLKIRNKPFDYFEPADGYVHLIGAFQGWPLMLSFANADSQTKSAQL